MAMLINKKNLHVIEVKNLYSMLDAMARFVPARHGSLRFAVALQMCRARASERILTRSIINNYTVRQRACFHFPIELSHTLIFASYLFFHAFSLCTHSSFIYHATSAVAVAVYRCSFTL